MASASSERLATAARADAGPAGKRLDSALRVSCAANNTQMVQQNAFTALSAAMRAQLVMQYCTHRHDVHYSCQCVCLRCVCVSNIASDADTCVLARHICASTPRYAGIRTAFAAQAILSCNKVIFEAGQILPHAWCASTAPLMGDAPARVTT